MKKNIFKLLGFSNEESSIYISLCSKPLQTLSELSKTTTIHRPHLYKVIPKLVDRGVVMERIVGKRTKYRPIEPVELYEVLRRQQAELGETIDELQSLYEKEANKPDIAFYVGKGGYTNLFNDIAAVTPTGSQVLRYSARKPDDGDFKTTKSYRERRNKGHYERLSITSAKKGDAHNKQTPNKYVKIVPKTYDLFEDHVSQTIYADKVAFIDHEHETTFIIESKKIAAVQRKLFKLLWRYLKEPR